jgi:acyl-CoA synthetase (AMP-forming)/AMP-acid ligase II/catechol 2,3-dioxygenase-like lactoylglutathione lyase family enzyme
MHLVHLGPAVGIAGVSAEHPAIIDCIDWERPRQLTYRELSERIDRVAGGLAERGLAHGSRIAVVSANRTEYLVAYFAILRCGCVCVPINYKLQPETIAFILVDSGVELVLCDSPRRAMVPLDANVIEFDTDVWAGLCQAQPAVLAPPQPQETAVILYTSGSTGRPKGVPLDHAGQQWTLQMRTRAIAAGAQHRLLVAAPLYHMNGLGNSIFTLAIGGTLVLMPVFDAERYIAAIARFKVTWLTSVPTMLAMVLKHPDLLAATDLGSVRTVRMGSAAFTPQLLAEVKRAFPRAVVGNAYGTTEAGLVVFGPGPDRRPVPDLALGWPLDGVETRIVDRQGREADEGVMWMRTPATMKGYLNLPERTAEVLTADGWYCTGDVVRRDAAGAYFFVGRSDDMFNCGGENVFPGEVEQLLERHPAIAQACVVAVPDEIKGFKPFAFVVTEPGVRLSEGEVKQFALANGPAYQHPRHVIFLPALPLAGTNKVDRAALAVRAAAVLRGDAAPPEPAAAQIVDLDHVGVVARDLETARAVFARLGFRLTSRSVHSGSTRPGGPVEPWASANHCAMFHRGYLEVAGLVSEVGYSTIGSLIDRYQGAHLVAFGSGTAEAMHQALRSRGVEAQAPRALERDAVYGAAGTQTRRARFSNVYVNAGEFPEARFIFIEHVTPDVIWQDHLLDHPNGVTALREIGFASTDPAATVERLGRLLGVAAAQDGADFCFRLPHTVAKVMSAQAWEARLPGATLLPLPAPVYIGFAVRSLAATRAYLVSASVPLVDAPSAVWVLPQHAAGAALMFCEEE